MSIPDSNMSKRTKYQALPPSILYILIFLTTCLSSQTPNNTCILDIQLSYTNNSDCVSGNWGGFINKCCRVGFDDYLYALGRRANLTGVIFLNSTEQMSCLKSIKEFDNMVFGCGIEKLTSGAGGCSDYTATDIVNKLGNRLNKLAENCKDLSSDGRIDQACTACLRSWEEISGSPANEIKPVNEADVCRFAVLVTLIGNRIDDTRWVQAVFKCLGGQPLSTGNLV